MVVESEKNQGLNLSHNWQNFSFNTVSRFMGFVVRLFLLLAGLATLFFELWFISLGFVIWLVFPPLSLRLRYRYLHHPHQVADHLVKNSTSISHLLDSSPGHFLCERIGIDIKVLTQTAVSPHLQFPANFLPNNFADIIRYLLETNVWPEEFFRTNQLRTDDLLMAADWWDKKMDAKYKLTNNLDFGPGLGTELTFGYTPDLDKYATDISSLSFKSPKMARKSVVSRMLRTLSAGSSVLLVGPPGVGKKTAIIDLARQLLRYSPNPHLAYHRVREVNFNDLLSQAILDLNHKKNIMTRALKEAASAGNLMLVIRDIHRFTNSAVEGFDFTDILEQQLDRKNLQIIALASPSEYERYISANLRLRKMFETVEIPPPSPEEMVDILTKQSDEWELDRKVIVTTPAIRQVISLAEKYITDLPFPRKGLELLDAAVAYRLHLPENLHVTATDVASVVTEKTGIPLANPTREEKNKLNQLEELIHKRLVGQDLAVTLVSRSLRSRATGLGGEQRPVGAFLFLGPTGVGKTETAKVLAQVYYGSEEKIMRFDMAEYAHRDGLIRLMGSPEYNQPGALTTAIKNRSAGMLLLDEIEKAPPEIYNLFLTLLDEGYITDAFGRRINCQHLFVIATSNAGSEIIRELVSSGTSGEDLQRQVIEYVLQKGWFSPEFINRFDAVVVYQPLSNEQLLQIASLQLIRLQERLLAQNIALEITPEIVKQLASHGYDPAFGARPMRRIIDLVIGDLLSRAILSEEIKPGDKIRLLPGSTPQSYIYEKIS